MSSWALLVAVGLNAAAAQAVDRPSVAIDAGPVAPASLTSTLAAEEVPGGFVRLPAALPIDIEIAEPVGSNINQIDDMFVIRVGAPVMVDGRIVIPSGTVGRGQVVHAARSAGFGKAGELILAARFIDCGALRIPLRGMRFEVSGKDKAGQVMALSAVIGIPVLFMKGGAALIPVGTHATAKLVAATDIPVAPGAACIGPTSSALPASNPSQPATPAMSATVNATSQMAPGVTEVSVKP